MSNLYQGMTHKQKWCANYPVDAAAEIERLTAERDNWKTAFDAATEQSRENSLQVAKLEAALKHYGKGAAWSTTVIDSYSGEVTLFDWDGELQDDPWGVAEAALKNTEVEVNCRHGARLGTFCAI